MCWRRGELGAVVEEYFTRLTADFSGPPYVGPGRSSALVGRVGRTHPSVRFGRQSVSAVGVGVGNWSALAPFFLARAEGQVAGQCPADWVGNGACQFSLSDGPRVFALAPPLGKRRAADP